ncbi:MAG: Thiol-disulfide oxidoreductase ResA [Verrucomicrobiae bacterium]|nr:Thiol-disulfide oxidoreductase ResA [Verrucomicrobiae bacterium]
MVVVATGVLAAEPRVAKPLPEFALTAVDGASLTSSNLAGKTLMIWFFASRDKPCLRQLPALQELQNEYQTNGLVVIGVALDQNGVEPIKTFIKTNQVSFPIAMAEYDFITDAGGLEAVPTTLVVEPRGNIISRYVGVTARAVLEADLKAIFNLGRD